MAMSYRPVTIFPMLVQTQIHPSFQPRDLLHSVQKPPFSKRPEISWMMPVHDNQLQPTPGLLLSNDRSFIAIRLLPQTLERHNHLRVKPPNTLQHLRAWHAVFHTKSHQFAHVSRQTQILVSLPKVAVSTLRNIPVLGPGEFGSSSLHMGQPDVVLSASHPSVEESRRAPLGCCTS